MTADVIQIQHSRPMVAAADDVRGLRERLGYSRSQFCMRFGICIHTLRDWEQGRRAPEGPARILLTVIEFSPEIVDQAIGVTRSSAVEKMYATR